MRILLPSDVFPPGFGGAGWSAHALAVALIERGHDVTALVPRLGTPGVTHEQVLGVPTIRWGHRAPHFPFVRNYFRHEWLWPRFADVLVELATTDHRPTTAEDRGWKIEDSNVSKDDTLSSILYPLSSHTPSILIHAQHVQTAPPAIIAGRRLGVPVVVTVRDHWPWDYFATGLHGDRLPYRGQTWASLATDLVARLGPVRGAAALPAIPYMLAHLRRRQRFLRQADAVVAVSDYVARRLDGIVAPERVHIIPNMLDLAAIAETCAAPPASIPPGQPYLLFVGKLERNKGAHLLVDIFRALADERRRTKDEGQMRGQVDSSFVPELVIAGSGPLRPAIERDLAALGVRARFLDWVGHDEVLRLMAHCTLLLFPSTWGDTLSRVLLEGVACGAPILAMPTGGTPSIIVDGVDGAIEPTVAGFARRLVALLEQPERRRALGAGARRATRERFEKSVVVGQIEALYCSLVRQGDE